MAQDTNTTVRGPLESTGATTPVYRFRRAATPYNTVRVMIYVPASGAWVGTITLQTSDPGRDAWVDEPSGAFTANTAQVFEPGGDCDIRLVFTSRTSGTAIGAILNGA